MRWEGLISLQTFNYLLAFLAISLGILIPFVSDQWDFEFLEKVLYTALFLSIGIVFLLFASSYQYNKVKLKKSRKVYFYIGNVTAAILLIISFLSFKNCINNNEFWIKESAHTEAKVYKIDPEGYQKRRIIYYIFEHNNKIYRGQKIDESKKYNIGDSITVMYSQIKPDENKVISK